GIRDDLVTGVQTCALPISSPLPHRNRSSFQWIAIWPPRSSVTAAAHKLTQISCTFCTGTGQMVPSHAQLGLRLALAEPDGAVPGVDGQRLASAVHLAVHRGSAKCPFYSHGNPAHADVSVPGRGV